MARNIAFVGGERQVNLLDPLPRAVPPTANGLLGDQQNPEIVALPNGNFVVVYENDAGGSGDFDILAVEFTATGVLVGNVFRVDFDQYDQFSPDVTPILTGGYAVAFEDNASLNSGSSFVSLEMVPPGSPADPDPEFVVEDPVGTFNETFDPSIATFANGSYIVTYDRFLDVANNSDTRFAIVNAAGNAFLTAPTFLGQSQTAHEFDTSVATFGNIAAVVYASEEEGNPASDDVVLKIVNASGTIVDTETIDTNTERNNPEVAALADGRFVVVWQDFNTTDVFGRIYDPDTGTFSGPEFIISNRGGFQESPRVAALPDGGFVATWTDFSGQFGDNSGAINARRFDKNGVPVGDEFRVSTATEDFQGDSGLAANDDGVLFSAWVNFNELNTTDTEPPGIQGQFLRAVTEVVNGTAGDDNITTYNLSEPVNGLAGKDTIDARGGNDIVNGGEGRDKLTGGPGSDAYVFDVKLKGKNVDHIAGFEPGVDQLRLDQDIFKKLKVGDLAKKAFFAGKKVDEGEDDKDLVVYDKKSGKFWYDADGPGGNGAKLVAILDGSPNGLKHEDIVVVA
ncbi:MAG: calcium-binding protein [Microvirga sp.]